MRLQAPHEVDFSRLRHIIDSNQGLSQMMGKRDLYLKVLNNFRIGQAHTALQIKQALKLGTLSKP